MRSFTIAAFASLAFGLFCSASPTPIANLPAIEVTKRGPPATLQSILTGTTTSISKSGDDIKGLKSSNADNEAYDAPLLDCKNTLLDTANQLNLLVDVDIDVILGGSDGTRISADICIKLITDLLVALVGPCIQALLCLDIKVLVEFAFQLLDILKPILLILLPVLYDLCGLGGVLSIVKAVLGCVVQVAAR